MDSRASDPLDNLSNPLNLRRRLISCSLFVLGYELCRDTLIYRVRSFYFDSFRPEAKSSDWYKAEVRSRSNSELYACLSWMQDNNVIDGVDLDVFESLKKTRNTIAHEFFQVLSGENPIDVDSEFQKLTQFFSKIEIWWVRNVLMPSDPQFDNVAIADEDITMPAAGILATLKELALSDEHEMLQRLAAVFSTKNRQN